MALSQQQSDPGVLEEARLAMVRWNGCGNTRFFGWLVYGMVKAC